MRLLCLVDINELWHSVSHAKAFMLCIVVLSMLAEAGSSGCTVHTAVMRGTFAGTYLATRILSLFMLYLHVFFIFACVCVSLLSAHY